MADQGGESFGEKLIQLWLLKSMEGESTIQETIQWNRETKGIVPLVQAGGLLAGLLVAAVGCWVMFAGVDAANRGDSGRTLVMVGLVVMVPGVLLAYRQGRDLLDPFGKTSPVERMLRPYIRGMELGAREEEQGDDGEGPPRMFPARNGGTTRAMAPAPKQRLPCHPEDAEMLEFIYLAKERGLGQARWLPTTGDRVTLRSTGTVVTRTVYDRIIGDLVHWQFVMKGGDGVAHDWRVQPDRAIEILKAEIVRLQKRVEAGEFSTGK